MNDRMSFLRASTALVGTALLAFAASPAVAGDAVLYGAAPAWVSPAKLPADRTAQQLLFETQHRLEAGTVTTYVDTAVRIATPEAAMQQGTIALGWMPDKGDLKVHRVEIVRAGQSVNVLDSAKFTVLRREQGLEQRTLDGALTATLAVPGLQVGDILRVTYSTTLADQALGKEMQLAQFLLPEPVKVASARTVVSWPEGEDIRWKAERGVPAEAVKRDGYRWLDVKLPIAKAAEIPSDAPSRFARPAVLRVGTYADWQELSRTMYPLFDQAAEITPGSALDDETRAIMAMRSKPLERAALALRMVQDEVSYLLNGMAGGNYLPQAAEDSWTKRYGDCKAKSVLLLAMLRKMGIEAQPVLVVSGGGDALPELLPLPADFDHMIVHARIDGKDYWLDGTMAGTRLANIDAVPAFYHALPLTAAGATLMPMTPRMAAQPDMAMHVTADYSAGVDLPYAFKIKLELYGPQAANLRALADSQDPAQLKMVMNAFAAQDAADGVISDMKLDYDADLGAALIALEGVGTSEFVWDKSRLALSPDFEDDGSGYNPDRARLPWRDIPVASPSSSFTRATLDLTLPDGGKGYTLQGPAKFDAVFASTTLSRYASLAGGRFRETFDNKILQGETSPADLAEAKRAARKVAASQIKLVAPADARRVWDLDPAELQKVTRPLAAIYDKAVAKAEKDDFRALYARAAFRGQIADYKGALADYDRIARQEPSAAVYVARSQVLESMGRSAEVIEDLRRAYDLEADNEVAFALAGKLAYAGRADDARTLLESLSVSEDQRAGFADSLATVTGLAGKTEEALAALQDEVSQQPQNAGLLNADCWFRGLFKVDLDNALENCTRAVERSQNAAAALDSRAMVRFRLGDYDAAISDLDAALALQPNLAASRYLRGIVRLNKGEAAGRQDIAAALRMAPEIAALYARHGVAPPR